MPEQILMVDDEPNVLDGYRRTLRKEFKIKTATSGQDGLQEIKDNGPFAVVVSDMQMPEMNGAQFLSKVKAEHPDIVRIMLTGNADQDTAVSAINDGDVFKFLNKPCPPEEMGATLNSAIEKYRKDTIEKRLLQETLNGAVAALLDILSITYPQVFGQTTSIVNYVGQVAKKLGFSSSWELETSARLCQVGLVTLPKSIVEKLLRLQPLSDEEILLYAKFPESGAKLIENIPRMEKVANNVRYLLKGVDGSGWPESNGQEQKIPAVSRVLRPVVDFQRILSTDVEGPNALARLREKEAVYDSRVLQALKEVVEAQNAREIHSLKVTMLGTNMYLARSLETKDGAMLVSKDQYISESLADRLINFWRSGAIDETIDVYFDGESQPY